MALLPKPKANSESDRLFLEELYDNYNNLMFKQARRFLQNQADVEDVVQQSFVKLIRYLLTLKKNRLHHLFKVVNIKSIKYFKTFIT